MSFITENFDNCKIGFDGEQLIRKWFMDNKIPFMQVDVMFKHDNRWYLGEIKSQEKYLSPPFDGHGLPIWQINRRLEFEKETGIVAYLFIYDLEDKCIYMQKFSELMNGKQFETKGSKPRIIFPIESFKKIFIN